MASSQKFDVPPTLIVYAIDLEPGESALVDLTYRENPPVMWDNGGVSWTITPTTPGAQFNCKVEHSLMPKYYDDAKYWTDDEDSPFTSETEGNEHFRVQRLRFTAITGDVTIVTSGNTQYSVETS